MNYRDFSEKDKQSLVIARLDDAKVAIENMPTGGGASPIEYAVDEDGKIYKANVNFKLPSNIKDLANYTFMGGLRGCSTLETADLSSLTTISGNNAAYYMFADCNKLTSVDLSSLTTISGDSAAYYMFSNCDIFSSVDLSSLTAINGTRGAYYMFAGCNYLISVDLSSLTTIEGNNSAYYMFNGCSRLTSVDLSSLTTINGTGAASCMFNNCSKLTSVDLSSLTTVLGSNAMQYAFQGCTSLKELRFPALVKDSFGANTNQLSKLLNGVNGCTIHFPAAIQEDIERMSGYPNFNGTNTTVLFDL